MGYTPGLSKEILTFQFKQEKSSKVVPRYILLCLQHQKRYLAESLVCGTYVSNGSRSKSATKSDSCKKSEAICTWTSPPTPPTMGSSSKTFTISTDEAGSSMVSESQTCQKSRKRVREKVELWVDSIQSKLGIQCVFSLRSQVLNRQISQE